jgi:hypothetical protein
MKVKGLSVAVYLLRDHTTIDETNRKRVSNFRGKSFKLRIPWSFSAEILLDRVFPNQYYVECYDSKMLSIIENGKSELFTT